LAIGPDNDELAGLNHGARRELPLQEVGVIVGQVIAAEIDGVGVAVVQFQPRPVMTETVGGPVHIVNLDFVQPNQRVRGHGTENGIVGVG
jgi:hypothetical protein